MPANWPVTDPNQGTNTIRRLLIVRISAMGDVLHTLPAVAALRLAWPDTRFSWVVEERWADLVRYARVDRLGTITPIVDQVHTVHFNHWRRNWTSLSTWQQLLGGVRELRAAHYDAAIDFQGAARSALLARFSAAPSIFGFAQPRENVASMFYTRAVLTGAKHVIAQNFALASAAAHYPLQPAPIYFDYKGSGAKLDTNSRSAYVVLNPGAGWGAKQWPAERYGEVARRLASELQLRCLINAGPDDGELVRAAQTASAGCAQPISCSPAELIDVVKNASLFIGGDTGPMHLAAMMGVPVVAIFGPTDPARTGPFATRSIVLRNPESRTTLSHQPAPDSAMLQITAEDVVAAAVQLLRDHA